MISNSASNLACKFQNSGTGDFGEPEPQCVELIEEWGNRMDQPCLPCIKKQSKRAGHRNTKEFRRPAAECVVEDHQRGSGLQGEGENGRLSRAKIRRERKRGGALGIAQGHPSQFSQIRHIISQHPPRIEFRGNGAWNNHSIGQRGEKIEPSQLVKVLERRGVADAFRQGGFHG